MQRRMRNFGGALFFAGVLAIAGCSAKDGTNGANGANGTNGTNGTDLTAVAKPESCEVCHPTAGADHQAIYNSFSDGLDPTTSKLGAQILGVASTDNGNGTFTSTVTFTVSKNGTGLSLTELLALKQKTIYAAVYTPGTPGTNGTFLSSFSYSVGTATVSGSGFSVTKTDATFAPEAAASGFVYAYFGDTVVIPTTTGHYALMDNVISVAKTYGAAIDYASTAKVSGCEQCHTKPYSKHGYRQAQVAGLPDFVSCKSCHLDNRTGVDYNLQMVESDPATFIALPLDAKGEPIYTSDIQTKYAYQATVMNDTHMSHAMEFAYPQSMANCVTCHADLSKILTEANFTPATCRSCHPETIAANALVTAGRAPALSVIMPATIHASVDVSASAPPNTCNACHKDSSSTISFKAIHSGYNGAIYNPATGARYADAVKVTIDSASLTGSSLDIKFSATSTDSALDATKIVPTVIISLYAYDTKDFLVSGHGSDANGARFLEFPIDGTTTNPRFTVVPTAAGSWEVKADLTVWASNLTDGSIKRAEIAVLPTLKDANGAILALNAPSRTFDLKANAFADSFYKPIVDPAKCNKCHDALGTTFHSADRGGNVVVCRVCHTVTAGGSHLEMQSRSIDSYVHAIHSFQYFDIKNVDFSDPVATFRYGEHTEESTYPNFSILNCESCHNPGTYDVPDQSKSAPGILSASAVIKAVNGVPTWDRNIGTVPAYVTGPASRACGSCHRARMINDDRAGDLAAFDSHTDQNGYMLVNGTDKSALNGASSVLNDAITKIQSIFK